MTEAQTADEIVTQEGLVLVVHNVEANWQNPTLLTRLAEMGFDSVLFENLMTLKHKWDSTSEKEGYPPKDPVEEIVVHTATTSDGKPLELTEVTAYKSHTVKTRIQRPPSESIGFEAVYVRSGTLYYCVLSKFGVAGYSYSGNHNDINRITLNQGDLILVPRPVARKVEVPGRLCDYVYLSDPWNIDDEPLELMME